MRDAVTIVGVHISRQHGQTLLNVDQHLSLDAGADFLQRIDEPGHFVGPDPTVQRKPIEPGIVLLIVWLGKNSDCVTDLINDYFGLSCGLNLDISRGPRSSYSGPMQCS